MKQKIHLAILIMAVLFTSCKEEVLAPYISGVETNEYLLNLGDKLVLSPDITNLKGNDYEWTLDGKKISGATTSYTFEANQPGTFTIIFKATNKGGYAEEAYKVVVEPPIEISFSKPLFVTPRSTVLRIEPEITGPKRDDYKYEWTLDDNVISKEKTFDFITLNPGNYELQLTVSAGKQIETTTCNIKVEDAKLNSQPVEMLEFFPAPAEGISWSTFQESLVSIKKGQTHLSYSDFLKNYAMIKQSEKPYMEIHLGSWGGYATLKFDHTVVNVEGKSDIKIRGKFAEVDKPAVYVAYDKNKNGKPDDDEWYKIKTFDWGKEDMPNYEISYTWGGASYDEKNNSIKTYFTWKDNKEQDNSGEISISNWPAVMADGSMNAIGFLPGYVMTDKSGQVQQMNGWPKDITFKGKRVTREIMGKVYFNQDYMIDIDMAVDRDGESVKLPGIDFIKVRKEVYPYFTPYGSTKSEDYNMKRRLEIYEIFDNHMN
ncbi:MAG: PKD-like domain-containing protein [Fermentimonas sp.]|jgi:hypothetical protein